MRTRSSLSIALFLGASCAGPSKAPAPAAPTSAQAATAPAPRGKPEVRYYEIADT